MYHNVPHAFKELLQVAQLNAKMHPVETLHDTSLTVMPFVILLTCLLGLIPLFCCDLYRNPN